MKIRMGFVSNSSSSSFCIVGVVINPEMFDKGSDNYDLENGTGLDVVYGIDEYFEERLVGKKIRSLKDDQTLGDFKEQVFGGLKKAGYLGNLEDIEIHVDGGYPG